MRDIRQAADAILAYTTERAGGAPGVVAMATDRTATFYEGVAGQRELGKPQPMTTDTIMAIASCTKAITGTALMQLVETGKLALDDPARAYVPEIAEIQVLLGFEADGTPRLRPPKSDITLNQLMLHTSGMTYEFMSAEDLRYRTVMKIPSIMSSTYASTKSVLVHDPGERWTYGVNTDWLGRVSEAVRGARLGNILREQVFAPLDMHDISFTITPDMERRRATVHERAADGQLIPAPALVFPQPPEMDMGGGGLYTTVTEYMKFIRMLLNDGAGKHGRVLQAATVQRMAQNGLGKLKSAGWTTSIPSLTNSGEFFPGLSKSWAYTFQVNDEQTPTGRPAGELMWAGLTNLYYWVDRKNGIGGMWGSQILPFQDVASYPGFVDFEAAVYRALK